VSGKERSGFGEGGEVAARGRDGTLSSNEFHAPSLADFFHLSK
jgi:hypothetical protein